MWKVEDFGSGALLFTAATDSLRVGITNWGGAITKIETFDQHGHMDHIAFGHDDCASYQGEKTRFFGCITGRFANRIARGRFALNGKEYTVRMTSLERDVVFYFLFLFFFFSFFQASHQQRSEQLAWWN